MEIPNFYLYLTDWNEIFVKIEGIENQMEARMTTECFEWKYKTDISDQIKGFKEGTIFANYPPKIATWALDLIKKTSAEIDPNQYDSAYRIAEKGNRREEKRYYKITDCCGSYDFEAVCPINNKTYLLGFNYGH